MECVTSDNPRVQENWLWRKNVPFIYDYLFMTPLKWPTLSFSIPPIRFNSENMEINKPMNDFETDPEIYSHGQLIVYGSYTNKNSIDEINHIESGKSDYYVEICLVDIPNFDIDLLTVKDSPKTAGLKKKPKYLNPDINTLLRFNVQEDIFKICSGINENNIKIASKTIKGKIIVHSVDIERIRDLGVNSRKRNHNDHIDDDFFDSNASCLLLGSENNSMDKSGYGMEWGTTNSNWLLSGNEDSSIYVYDVDKNNVIFESSNNCSNSGINDLSWLNPNLTPNVFTTVNHLGYLSVYDFRINKRSSSNLYTKRTLRSSASINSNNTSPVNEWNISDCPCLSVSVHPCISNLISIGCYDGNVNIIDLRYLSNKKNTDSSSSEKFIVNKLKYGKEGVHRVEWHSGGNGLLLSSSLDGKVSIWDITKSNNLPLWEQLFFDNNNQKSKNNRSSVKSTDDEANSDNLNSKHDIDILKNSLKTIIGNKSSSWNKSERLDGPDELLGIHSGHLGYVTDSHWIFSPDFDSWTVASSDTLNGFHIWSFNEALFSSENDLIELAYAKSCPFFNDTNSVFSTKSSIENLINSL